MLFRSIFNFSVFQSCNSEQKEIPYIVHNESDNKAKVYSEDHSGIDKIRSIDSLNQSLTGERQNAITKAVQKCSPAIVGINVTEVVKVEYQDPFFDDPLLRHFFGRRDRGYVREYEVRGLGSGFMISPDGYILTNHHVAGNASKIIVTTTDGKKYDADIIGADMVSDVAVLKIKGTEFPYLNLANSDNVIIGEWAISFGNPFGLFDLNAKPTVTVGVISNKGINFTQDNRVYKDMIQTDAAISSGNSGGPLVNALGEVIGINTIIFSTSQSNRGAGSIGIGWSIPINRVKKIVDILIKDKQINRNYVIGMEVREIDAQIARYLKLPNSDGVVVVSINRNSEADKAGIMPGDIITEINGVKVLSINDYVMVINDCVVGDNLNITLARDGKTVNTKMELKQARR